MMDDMDGWGMDAAVGKKLKPKQEQPVGNTQECFRTNPPVWIKASAKPPSDKIRDFIESKIKSRSIFPSVLFTLAIYLKTSLTCSKQTHKVYPPSLTRSSDLFFFLLMGKVLLGAAFHPRASPFFSALMYH